MEMAASRLLLAQVIYVICFFVLTADQKIYDKVGCLLSRFDPRLMLERIRGKRLMFVGDSLNRNQWESMVCLVQSVVPPGKKSLNKSGSLSVFRIEVGLKLNRCNVQVNAETSN